ncbi:Leucine-rich repeats-containing protein [Candidatus Trichorickettsia mobilis]|uniref:Leucine-rich repeats-containing protein n=1 Tax=Candidatus Trichorickettsia mobilis TaxID=1346319 RepID=A0ABZ0UWC9_9RICK|nr:hypothetical protein [Candidatus Trichorickettsia mobilis]WPY00922.1 Leucine-rich repeats-containing protein [Candidatus Trichorickettsia mobilis]
MSKIKSYNPQPAQTSFLQKLCNLLSGKSYSHDKSFEQVNEITIETSTTDVTITFKESNANIIDYSASCLNLEYSQLIIKKNLATISKLLICGTIKGLNLASNALGDKTSITLAGIFNFSVLKYLNLNSNLIGDKGIEAIFANLPLSIQVLYVGDNKFGDCGLITLTERLPEMQIKFLDICCNSISSIGLKRLALTLPHTKIVSLDVRGNFSNKEGVDFIEKNIPPTIKYLNTMCYNSENMVELVGKVIGNAIEYTIIGNATEEYANC